MKIVFELSSFHYAMKGPKPDIFSADKAHGPPTLPSLLEEKPEQDFLHFYNFIPHQ